LKNSKRRLKLHISRNIKGKNGSDLTDPKCPKLVWLTMRRRKTTKHKVGFLERRDSLTFRRGKGDGCPRNLLKKGRGGTDFSGGYIRWKNLAEHNSSAEQNNTEERRRLKKAKITDQKRTNEDVSEKTWKEQETTPIDRPDVEKTRLPSNPGKKGEKQVL